MKNYAGATFRGERAWSGPDIATFPSAVVKLRWTDQPFRWHVNTGEEVFAVLDGIVDMHVREAGVERIITLRSGDVLHIESGEEHVAHPRGEARILVVEQPKSA
jgi:mannose-6-phosphate isomerase-like protein (cupin superfamily)